MAIPAPFALSAYEVTFADYDRFTHPNKVSDRGWGRGTRPVINVSWDDAREYVAWLSSQTGAEYRPAERGGVGVRGACRDGDEIQLGKRHRRQPGELR